tara:strand:- start:933 stop:1076 length:144 start_codon:yes stop_codon:yes gene_type:complete
MATEIQIINFFRRTNRGIRGTARYFGVSKVYVGKIVTKYLKKHNLRI